MKPKNLLWMIPGLALLVSPALADIQNASISTTIIDTPYLDFNIWLLITLLGLGLLILSNITSKEQNSALWAVLCPFFTFPAMRFALMIQTMSYVPFVDSSNVVHISIQQTVFHPEWLAFILGVVFIISLVNIWYILTKKPVERQERDTF